MPGVRGFERASPSQAGDEGTTAGELDDQADGPREDGLWAGGVWADGPQADGLREELSLGNRVWADRAMQLRRRTLRTNQPIEVSLGANDPLYSLLAI